MLRAFVNRALSVVTDVYLNENSAAAGKEQKPRVTEVVSFSVVGCQKNRQSQ